MAYRVHVDTFEGPMDLLLYLVRRHDVDIFDIPIAQITRQFLEYIQLMRSLDLDIAGDFVRLASTLIRIKARMLLPKDEEEEIEDEDDPRGELIKSLLEYQEYKKLAETLDSRQEVQRNVFYRSIGLDPSDEKENEILDVSLFDLLAAFKGVLKEAPAEAIHEVVREEISLEERITYMSDLVAQKRRISFAEMFPAGATRVVLVVTFMALLELIKKQRIRIGQSGTFGDIWVYYRQPSKPQDSAFEETSATPAMDGQ